MTTSQSNRGVPSPTSSAPSEASWLIACYFLLALEIIFLFAFGSLWVGGLLTLGVAASAIRHHWQEQGHHPGTPITGRTLAPALLALAAIAIWAIVNSGSFTPATVQARSQSEPRAPAATAAGPTAFDTAAIAHASLPQAQRIADWWNLEFTIRDYTQVSGGLPTLAKPSLGESDAAIQGFVNTELIRACRYDTAYADGILTNSAADPLYPPAGATEWGCAQFQVDGSLGVDNPQQTGAHRQYHGTVTSNNAQSTGNLAATWVDNAAGGIWTFVFTPDA